MSRQSPPSPHGPPHGEAGRHRGPVLALDVGERRTGIARSDPDRVLAVGLPTFHVAPGKSIKKHFEALHDDVPFTGVVIGMPLHTDGRPGDLAEKVLRLGEWIASRFGVPVAYQDERFTTEEAIELLRAAPRRVRSEKGVRDRLAAQIILREFLAAGCPFPDDQGGRLDPKVDE